MNVVEHQANGIEDQGLNPQLAAEVKRAKRLDTFKRLLAIALLLFILLVAVWALQYELSKPAVGREWIVFMVAGALLAGATMFFFRRGQDMRDPKNVRFVISYDVVVAIILGLSATFIQCANWAAGGLLAGACLFIGGFLGCCLAIHKEWLHKTPIQRPEQRFQPQVVVRHFLLNLLQPWERSSQALVSLRLEACRVSFGIFVTR